MTPALRSKLDQCYRTRRTLFLVAIGLTGLYTAWSLTAMSRSASAGQSVFLPLLLTCFGAVGLSLALRAFLPLRSLANAPVTRLMREHAEDVAWVHAETKATTSKGQAIRQIVLVSKDGTRHTVTLGALLPGFEEELVALLLAEAPNAQPGPHR